MLVFFGKMCFFLFLFFDKFEWEHCSLHSLHLLVERRGPRMDHGWYEQIDPHMIQYSGVDMYHTYGPISNIELFMGARCCQTAVLG